MNEKNKSTNEKNKSTNVKNQSSTNPQINFKQVIQDVKTIKAMRSCKISRRHKQDIMNVQTKHAERSNKII